MKKVIFAAMAVSLLALVGCQGNQAGTAAAGNDEGERTESKREISGGVAYVHIDSLLMSYDMAVDMQNAFQVKVEKIDKELNSKVAKWERDALDAQDKVQKGLVTRAQAADLEQSLGMRQQQIMQDREKMMGELAEEESVMNNKIFYAVSDYLKEYNSDYRYSMIISTTSSGPILNADPSLSITAEVLKALNERYAAEKASSQKK